MVGEPGLQKLAAARVLVVGLGAVGSFAVEALARTGVGHLTLIDADVIEPSNINRQLYALGSTIGQPKCELAAARVADINPDCQIDARQIFVSASNLPELLAPGFDAVVDAIDSIDAKVELICAALDRGIPIFSSMGAARRRDPSAIKVADVSKTSGCPLAREVRRRLRDRGIKRGVTCVYSTEGVDKTSFITVGPDSIRLMGSLPTLTAAFGLRLAHSAIEKLLV